MRVLQLRRRVTGRGVSLPARRLCFNADGGILTANYNTPTGWTAIETHSGAPAHLPSEDRGLLTCAAYSWNGEYAAVGSADGVARAYRIADEVQLAALNVGRPHVGITDISFAPTAAPKSQWLAACGDEFWLWNPLTQQYLVAPEPGIYRCVAFGTDCHAVHVTSANEVICFTIRPFAESWRYRTTGTFPVFIRASPDSTCLAVTTDGLTLLGICAEDGTERLRTTLIARPRGIAFVPNSRLLAVADGSPTLRVYDTDTGTLAREYDWGIGGVHCVTFSNDGAMGAAGGDKGRVVVWDVD